jgi:hypothetical protein
MIGDHLAFDQLHDLVKVHLVLFLVHLQALDQLLARVQCKLAGDRDVADQLVNIRSPARRVSLAAARPAAAAAARRCRRAAIVVVATPAARQHGRLDFGG